MSLDEIVAAATKLRPAEFLKLRRRLDRIEEGLWQEELARTSQALKKSGLTDATIDRLVLRRRRESRR